MIPSSQWLRTHFTSNQYNCIKEYIKEVYKVEQQQIMYDSYEDQTCSDLMHGIQTIILPIVRLNIWLGILPPLVPKDNDFDSEAWLPDFMSGGTIQCQTLACATHIPPNVNLYKSYIHAFRTQFHHQIYMLSEEMRNQMIYSFHEDIKQFDYEDSIIEILDEHTQFCAFCLYLFSEHSSCMDIVLHTDTTTTNTNNNIKQYIKNKYVTTLLQFVYEIIPLHAIQPSRSPETKEYLRRKIMNVILPIYFMIHEIEQSIIQLFRGLSP